MGSPLYIVSLYYDRYRVTGANKRFDELGARLLQLYPGECTVIVPEGHRPEWCPENRHIGIRPYRGKFSRLVSWLQLSLVMMRAPKGIIYSDFQPAPLMVGLKHYRLQLIHDLRNWTSFGRGGLGVLSTAFQRYQLRSAFAVVTVSEASKDDIVGKCGVPPERVIVSYNGLAESYREDVTVARDIDLVYVATFEPRKNHVRLLEAIERIPEIRSVVLIGRDLGSRAEVDSYIRASTALSERQLTVIESVDEAEMVRTYQRAKLFVSPSLLEGFGMPLLEAAACGAKIACSDLAVFREICGDAAAYFDPLDVTDMARTIQASLCSASGHGLDVAAFRWPRITRDLITAMNAQVNPGRPAAAEIELRD